MFEYSIQFMLSARVQHRVFMFIVILFSSYHYICICYDFVPCPTVNKHTIQYCKCTNSKNKEPVWPIYRPL